MDRVQEAIRRAVSRPADVHAERLDGGCGSEYRHARADRRAGDQSRPPGDFRFAQQLAARISQLDNVGQVYIPQDMDYPALRMEVDRVHAAELGLTQKDIVDNVITALNSNAMIAPNYWSDKTTGNNYFLTVQYYENGTPAIHNPARPEEHSFARAGSQRAHTLDPVVKLVKSQIPPKWTTIRFREPRKSTSHKKRRPRPGNDGDSEHREHGSARGQHARQSARHGARHAGIVPQFRDRA